MVLRDGPFRAGIKALVLRLYEARVALHRFSRRRNGEIPYDLGGACVLCARCCEAPAIQVSAVTWYLPLVRRAFLVWHRLVNGFELVERSRPDRLFVFRCTHFDSATRRCDSYHSRPGMCRDYPRVLMEQADPQLFEGCGFKPVSKNRARLQIALDAQPLSREQRAKLSKELYLED
jgi:Fe-S-cluster containining protein